MPMNIGQAQQPVPLQTGPAATPEEYQQRVAGWMQFFDKLKSDPQLQQSLLSFGTHLMQPVPVGQSPLGHLATGINAGENTYAALLSKRQQDQQQQFQNKMTEQKVGAQTTTADAAVMNAQTNARKQMQAESMSPLDKAFKKAQTALAYAKAAQTRAGQGKDVSAEVQANNALAEAFMAQNPKLTHAEAYQKAAEFRKKSANAPNPAVLKSKLYMDYLKTYAQLAAFQADPSKNAALKHAQQLFQQAMQELSSLPGGSDPSQTNAGKTLEELLKKLTSTKNDIIPGTPTGQSSAPTTPQSNLAPSGIGASPENPAKPTTQEQWNALPSGAYFYDPVAKKVLQKP